MKSTGTIMLGIWCAVTSFLSGFMDEGTAGIIGVAELVLWIVIGLLPDIWFIKRMKTQGWHHVCYALGGMAAWALLCVALCGWDMVSFLCG